MRGCLVIKATDKWEKDRIREDRIEKLRVVEVREPGIGAKKCISRPSTKPASRRPRATCSLGRAPGKSCMKATVQGHEEDMLKLEMCGPKG